MTRQSVGRTFLVAMSVLGLAACLQIALLSWQIFHPAPDEAAQPGLAEVPASSPNPTPAAATPATAEGTATAKTAPASPSSAVPGATADGEIAPDSAAPSQEESVSEAEQQLLASAAEKQLIASLPKPTPVPARQESPQEARITGLINLARALRERGDTSTALTRLREAQVLSPDNPQIISEMAMTYEKMGLEEKAFEQWNRIYEIGEKAGIYYAAAEAKLRATRSAPAAPDTASEASLLPDGMEKVLSLGAVKTTDDTGNTKPQRRLKVRIPIQARPNAKIDVHDVVIQVYFYDQLKDGSLVETSANVSYAWVHRIAADGSESPVDWKSPEPEVLEVEYSQGEAEPAPGKNSKVRRTPPERRNYFGYAVRLYYKGDLNASYAEPEKLLTQFPPPVVLQTSDLPQ